MLGFFPGTPPIPLFRQKVLWQSPFPGRSLVTGLLGEGRGTIRGEPLFEMCCFHMGIARKGRGCKGLPGGFGALFRTFARLTEGRGYKAIWAMPI